MNDSTPETESDSTHNILVLNLYIDIHIVYTPNINVLPEILHVT